MHPATEAQAGISRSPAMTEQLPKGYSPRLYNQDLGPLPQKWNWYNIFAFW
jgi:cytosine/uracil/thiamine/allantoin permease